MFLLVTRKLKKMLDSSLKKHCGFSVDMRVKNKPVSMLRKCPFCGKRPRLVSTAASLWPVGWLFKEQRKFWKVSCHCGVTGMSNIDPRVVIKHWNNRVEGKKRNKYRHKRR